MRIVATSDVVERIRAGGGRVFVWVVPMRYGAGIIFGLESAMTQPEEEHDFVTFRGDSFEVLLDSEEHGTPDALHLALRGWPRQRVRAYWNGNSFGRG